MSSSARLLVALVVSITSLLGAITGLLSVFIIGWVAIPVGVSVAAAGPWVGVVICRRLLPRAKNLSARVILVAEWIGVAAVVSLFPLAGFNLIEGDVFGSGAVIGVVSVILIAAGTRDGVVILSSAAYIWTRTPPVFSRMRGEP